MYKPLTHHLSKINRPSIIIYLSFLADSFWRRSGKSYKKEQPLRWTATLLWPGVLHCLQSSGRAPFVARPNCTCWATARGKIAVASLKVGAHNTAPLHGELVSCLFFLACFTLFLASVSFFADISIASVIHSHPLRLWDICRCHPWLVQLPPAKTSVTPRIDGQRWGLLVVNTPYYYQKILIVGDRLQNEDISVNQSP